MPLIPVPNEPYKLELPDGELALKARLGGRAYWAISGPGNAGGSPEIDDRECVGLR